MLTGLRIPCSDLLDIQILERMGHKCIFKLGFMLVLSVLLMYYIFRNSNDKIGKMNKNTLSMERKYL